MTHVDLQAVRASSPGAAREGPQGLGPEQAAKNREIAKAIRTINEGGGVGPTSELRFSIDRDTGRALIRIVDRVTNEVIAQVPPEATLRTAQILQELNQGSRNA